MVPAAKVVGNAQASKPTVSDIHDQRYSGLGYDIHRISEMLSSKPNGEIPDPWVFIRYFVQDMKQSWAEHWRERTFNDDAG